MASPPEPHDIRLRKHLDGTIPAAAWPDGYSMRPFAADDAAGLHALLTSVFDDGSDGPFETWWPRLQGDPQFDPALCFLVFAPDGVLAAAALCWTTGFIKDLAVRPEARRRGLGRALMLHAFGVFRQRGAAHCDLKTNLVSNAEAVVLYERLGMVQVDWEG